ncbi:hypothetical protein GO986_19415 [Deinococcus sp. HMF7620]|uniref:Lantibiotic dehydratase n=1 Tax=Deinococcus arboris TaxID=2682977 RepID=A0A7C9HTX3_9DEIO|nr:lantibiotic dehydratase [Deinococcus arboris]MVN88914.1 hypothetical protein [Deinococcus arboris]
MYQPKDNQFFILRSPIFPISRLKDIEAIKSAEEMLEFFLQDSKFTSILREHVPNVLAELERIEVHSDKIYKEELNRTLLKYFLRACTRSTPYRMFSGVGLGYFAPDNSILPQREASLKIRHSPSLQNLQSFSENFPTLDEFTHYLNTITQSPKIFLSPSLRVRGKRLYLEISNVSSRDVPSARNSIRLTPPVNWILEKIKQSNPCDLENLMEEFQTDFSLDKWQAVKFIFALFEKSFLYLYDNSLKITKTSQINAEINLSKNNLTYKVYNLAKSGSQVMAQLANLYVTPTLQKYAQDFYERYGEAEISLLDLLDPSVSMGLPEEYSNNRLSAPLDLSTFQGICHRLILCAVKDGKRSVDIKDELKIINSTTDNITTDVFCTVLIDSGSDSPRLLLHSINGIVPAGRSMFRFSVFDESIGNRLSQEIACSNTSSIIISDIQYTPPMGELTDIHHHNVSFPNTILTNGLGAEDNISLNDIKIVFRNNKLRIISASRNAEIFIYPSSMLSPAYLPTAIRFLFDVSAMHFPEVAPWQWGIFREESFLPRITHGSLILSSCSWRLPSAKSSSNEIKSWREKNEVDRFILVGTHDHKIIIDLDHPLQVTLLKDLIKKGATRCEESFHEQSSWLEDENKEKYTHEIVIPIGFDSVKKVLESDSRGSRLYRRPDKTTILASNEYLYFKYYSEPEMHLEILQMIYEYVKDIGEVKMFFVRYSDDRQHLRVRFKSSNAVIFSNLRGCIDDLNLLLIDKSYAADIRTDIYRREVFRYGGQLALNIIEDLFHHDSCIVFKILNLHEDHFLLSIKHIIQMAYSLLLTDIKILDFFSRYKDYISSNLSPSQKNSSSERLRNYKHVLDLFLSEKPKEDEFQYNSVKILWESAQKNFDDQEQFDDICMSVMHMSCNRLGLSRPDELSVYHIIYKTFLSRLRRSHAY